MNTCNHQSAICRSLKRFPLVLFCSCALSAAAQNSFSMSPALSTNAEPALTVFPEPPGLLPTNWNMGFTVGTGFGLNAMGSTRAHDLAIGTLHVGKLLTSDQPVLEPLLHHVELAGELWSGAQYHPDTAYLVGLTPIVSYHLLPGSRWSPFLDGGAGLTATDIGPPDLSTTFEFNLQAGAGFHWILRQNLGLTFRTRYMHLSNAHIDTPNLGVNSVLFSGGLTWFF
jgi:lipid A 3-O-deacylase